MKHLFSQGDWVLAQGNFMNKAFVLHYCTNSMYYDDSPTCLAYYTTRIEPDGTKPGPKDTKCPTCNLSAPDNILALQVLFNENDNE